MTRLLTMTTTHKFPVQAVKVEEGGDKLPDYLELVCSHDAWGVRSRVDLIWTSLEGITKVGIASKYFFSFFLLIFYDIL